MLFHNVRSTRPVPSSKFVRSSPVGMYRFSRRIERGFAIEIWARKVGVTVTRTLYNVALFSADGERVASFTDLASLKHANQAATRWIHAQQKPARSPRRAVWPDEPNPRPRGGFFREPSATPRGEYPPHG